MMRFQRRLQPNTGVNLVPMIDVVLQMVFFFMVSTSFSVNPGISLVLPESTTAEPVAMTNLVVSVISTEEIYLNTKQYNIATIAGALAGISAEQRSELKTIIVEGNKSAPYDLI